MKKLQIALITLSIAILSTGCGMPSNTITPADFCEKYNIGPSEPHGTVTITVYWEGSNYHEAIGAKYSIFKGGELVFGPLTQKNGFEPKNEVKLPPGTYKITFEEHPEGNKPIDKEIAFTIVKEGQSIIVNAYYDTHP